MKLNNKLIAIALLMSLAACSSSKKTSATKTGSTETAMVTDAEHDGSSFEKAIVVKNISQEYAYVRQVCPECKTKKQSLNKHGDKYYDILTFDKDGTEVRYYFDINSFFGKGFN